MTKKAPKRHVFPAEKDSLVVPLPQALLPHAPEAASRAKGGCQNLGQWEKERGESNERKGPKVLSLSLSLRLLPLSARAFRQALLEEEEEERQMRKKNRGSHKESTRRGREEVEERGHKTKS